MGHFTPSPGMDNCPKCFGWQIRDLTKRNAAGWPLGPEKIEDCDHCKGRGEIPAKPGVKPLFGGSPFAAPMPTLPVGIKAPEVRSRRSNFVPPPVIDDIPWGGNSGGPVKIEPETIRFPVGKLDTVSEGWANFNVDKPAEPAKGGWEIFNKEPGK
jgi:hypothetical protein